MPELAGVLHGVPAFRMHEKAASRRRPQHHIRAAGRPRMYSRPIVYASPVHATPFALKGASSNVPRALFM